MALERYTSLIESLPEYRHEAWFDVDVEGIATSLENLGYSVVRDGPGIIASKNTYTIGTITYTEWAMRVNLPKTFEINVKMENGDPVSVYNLFVEGFNNAYFPRSVCMVKVFAGYDEYSEKKLPQVWSRLIQGLYSEDFPHVSLEYFHKNTYSAAVPGYV